MTVLLFLLNGCVLEMKITESILRINAVTTAINKSSYNGQFNYGIQHHGNIIEI